MFYVSSSWQGLATAGSRMTWIEKIGAVSFADLLAS